MRLSYLHLFSAEKYPVALVHADAQDADLVSLGIDTIEDAKAVVRPRRSSHRAPNLIGCPSGLRLRVWPPGPRPPAHPEPGKPPPPRHGGVGAQRDSDGCPGAGAAPQERANGRMAGLMD